MEQFTVDKKKLNDLLDQIGSGRLKLPSFQREYKWKPSQVIKLLDSIHKQHPAGSLLFLEVDKENILIKDEPFKYIQNPSKGADFLVLDGQQRLTSCYCAVYNKGTKTYYFNLNKFFKDFNEYGIDQIDDFEQYLTIKKYDPFPDQFLYSKHLLPLCFLKSKTTFKEGLASYKNKLRDINYDQLYIDFIDTKLEVYLESFFEYIFPAVILPKYLDLPAICKVFQSINSTGLKLSAFDICVAKFMANNINLKEKIKATRNSHGSIIPTLDDDESIILQIIALLSDKPPKKNSLPVKLHKNDIVSCWDKAVGGLTQAVQFLKNIGVGCDKNLSLVPYQPTIPVIAAVLADVDFAVKPVSTKGRIEVILKKWFYTISLKQRYTEGTDNKMREDYNHLKEWIFDDSKKPDYMTTPVMWNINQIMNSNKSGAVGKTILCLINSIKPKDFYTNTQVGIGSGIDSQMHHIFPIARYWDNYKELLNSVFNFTFLTPESNTFICDKKTNEYIHDLSNKNESKFQCLLENHLIDYETFNYLKNEDYHNFLKSRILNIKNSFEKYFEINIAFIESTSDDEINDDDDFNLENGSV